MLNNKLKILDLVFSNSIYLNINESDNLFHIDPLYSTLNIIFQINKPYYLSFNETSFDFKTVIIFK